jgi:hypothetical protein
VQVLPTLANHPVVERIFTADLINDLVGLWELRDKDVHPRNVFIRENGCKTQSVAIDWAFCGRGPVGQELSALVGATQPFLESRPEQWDDLERDCLEGYGQGRRQAGWRGSDHEMLLGYLLSAALRFGIGSLPPVLHFTLTTEHQDLITRVMGCRYEEILTNTAAVLRFQQRRIHQTRALLGI